MNKYNLDNETRPIVNHIGDIVLAYIAQRYKEIHDFVHTALQESTSVEDELLVKVFEFEQTGLFSTGLAAKFGPAMLGFKGVNLVMNQYGEWISQAKQAKNIMCIYWEKHFDRDFEEFRNWFLCKI